MRSTGGTFPNALRRLPHALSELWLAEMFMPECRNTPLPNGESSEKVSLVKREGLNDQGGLLPAAHFTAFSGPVSSEEPDCRTHHKDNGNYGEKDPRNSGTSV